MWGKRAHAPAPLTQIFSMQVKFKWDDLKNYYFIDMKKIVGHDVLFYYPNFSERFIIHTDAIKKYLGGVIIQNGDPIAFYSLKLIPAQINYTTIDIKLLIIVETLKYL